MAEKKVKDAFHATLHGAESYTAGEKKFLRGKRVSVSAALASRLPGHKFSISPIEPEEPEEDTTDKSGKGKGKK